MSADMGDSADQELALTWPEYTPRWFAESETMDVGLRWFPPSDAGEAGGGLVCKSPSCAANRDCVVPVKSFTMLK